MKSTVTCTIGDGRGTPLLSFPCPSTMSRTSNDCPPFLKSTQVDAPNYNPSFTLSSLTVQDMKKITTF